MTQNDSILDWVMIGGGFHGTHLSNVLIKKRITGKDDLRVIEPHNEALALWKNVKRNVGMEYLRSPKVHHLDLELFDRVYVSGPLAELEVGPASKNVIGACAVREKFLNTA